MATLVASHELDLAELRKHLGRRLPSYARPLFLRIRDDAEVTSTFKYSKTELVRQGYDPAECSDPLYVDLVESEVFVELDKALFDRIQNGGIRW
jgi:fatty-acyl-CoA synthase